MDQDSLRKNISSKELPSTLSSTQTNLSKRAARYRFRRQPRNEFVISLNLMLIVSLTQLIIAHSGKLGLADGRIPPPAKIAFAYGDKATTNSNNNLDALDQGHRDRLVRQLLLDYPSERNLDLVRRLNNRQLDYQVFYPTREIGDTRSGESGSEVSGQTTGKRQGNSKHARPFSAKAVDSSTLVAPTDYFSAVDPFVSLFTPITGSRNGDSRSSKGSGGGSSLAASLKQAVANSNRPRRHSESGGQQQETLAPTAQRQTATKIVAKANQVSGHYNRTNVVIKAYNYKFRLDLELNNNLFGPSLIQKHFLPKGAQQISTQTIEHCYYHARTQLDTKPYAIGAFRTCNGLSGIIHVNNESIVIQPFYVSDSSMQKRHPHIIYKYQQSNAGRPNQSDNNNNNNHSSSSNNYNQLSDGGTDTGGGGGPVDTTTSRHECGNTRLPHEWALRQYNKLITLTSNNNGEQQQHRFNRQSASSLAKNCTDEDGDDADGYNCDTGTTTNTNANTRNNTKNNRTNESVDRFSKRDVSLTEKYIELALVLSKDMFDKRNSTSRTDVLHDAIQIVNCLDLYFRSANTRVSIIYIETWAHGDQIEISKDAKKTMYNFLEYTIRKLYKVSADAAHLLTGGHTKQFDSNEVGMSMPGSICSPRAVSVSQEASIFEPFIAASTIAHMLGHNLGMEHDELLVAPEEQAGGLSRQTIVTSAHQQQQAPLPPTATTLLNVTPPGLPLNTPGGGQMVVRMGYPHRYNQPAPGAGHHQAQDQQEEHEDEIKSRSIVMSNEPNSNGGRRSSRLIGSAMSPSTTTITANNAPFDTNNKYCRSNCLMSERFAYLQPPISFGYMTQQEVAIGSNNSSNTGNQMGGDSSSFMISMSNTADSSASVQTSSSLNHHHLLNGPTMNQIDNELQNEHISSVQQTNVHVMATSLPFRFSKQSIEAYHKLLREGRGICLFNKPNQLEDFNTCGNGIVDKGEDCDCGKTRECEAQNDTCCDPITCKFKVDAECITGACCDGCKLRPKGFVCRKSRSECDLDEMCDGKSGQCSPDVHKQNGHPCQANTGYCYLGQCPLHDTQCSELWGSDGRKSDRLCYTNFNLNATIRGNCGYDTNTHKYKRCDLDNIMCGTLQCQLGDMKPITAPVDTDDDGGGGTTTLTNGYEFSKKTLHTYDGKQYECKVITGPAKGNQVGSISYVRDGSKCNDNKVCFNQTCQPLEVVYRDSFELCPHDEKERYCSGNGICSTANRCHCDPGWTGHDCSQRWTPPLTAAITTGSNGHESSRLTGALYVDNLLKYPILDNSSTSTSNVPIALAGPLNSLAAPSSGGGALQPERNIVMIPNPVLVVPNVINPLPQPATAPHLSTANISTTAQESPLIAPEVKTMAPVAAAPAASNGTTQTAATNDKAKGLGAPTLVFILVTIVAAVYLGFALMANCYRRKGLIKPDKVLRHHQMNCKLDAIRSTFIAKRLADAATLASTLETGSMRPPMSAGSNPNGVDFVNPFVPPMSAQPPCPHISSLYSPGGIQEAPDIAQLPMGYDGDQEAIMKSYMVQQQQQQQQAKSSRSLGANQQQFAATVHYFDESRDCVHQRGEPIDQAFSYGPDHSGDHIPLLMGSISDHHQARNQRPMNQQLTMRSFNAGHTATQMTKKANQYIHQDRWGSRNHQGLSYRQQQQPKQQQSRFVGQQINRATSLGNVNCQPTRQDNRVADGCNEVDYEDDEARRTMTAHRALATPLRVNSGHRGLMISSGTNHYRGTNVEPDSCSAPSSPEHRDPCWSDAERQRRTSGRQVEYSLNRIPSASRLPNSQRQLQQQFASGYHEDVILGALSSTGGGGQQQQQQQQRRSLVNNVQAAANKRDSMRQQHSLDHQQVTGRAESGGRGDKDDDDDEELPPLPPPPPPASHLLDDGVEGGETSDEEDGSETSLAGSSHHQHRFSSGSSTKRLQQVDSSSGMAGRVPLDSSSTMRTIRRIPLNDNGEPTDEATQQLSLIAQLQQLERVQSLHQKQVTSDKKLPNTNDGLHEFFSLPLSVQLSALLARSLRQESQRDLSIIPIDDYLNTLNNSSVATSSRRSFKRTSSQQSTSSRGEQTGSRVGTLKRQQLKLNNLQGLIDRLQKLQNQTILQQQLDELNGGLDDDLTTRGSRQSTLSRSSHHKRPVSRANQTADDLFTGDTAGWGRGGLAGNMRRVRRSRDNMSGSKNESIYSMSDSEDGAYVSRMLISYQQKQVDSMNNNVQDHQQELSDQVETCISKKCIDQQQAAGTSSGSPPSSIDVNSCVDQPAQPSPPPPSSGEVKP